MKFLSTCLLLGLLGSATAQEINPVIEQLSPAEVKATWEKLNSLIAKSGGIDPTELERARLQGVLQRLGKNARLSARPGPDSIAQGVNFKAEMLPRSILYARLGDLAADNISQLADRLRKEAQTKALILDLRASRGLDTYEQAANLIALFTGGSKTLFSLVSSENTAPKPYAGTGDLIFNGIILVLVNEDSNGPAEVVAAVLRQQLQALIVGRKTKGEALDYSSLLINPRIHLEIAVGRVVLPGLPADYLQNGVVPDLSVAAKLDDERELLSRSEKEGISPFLFEVERPHMNEASLVAGRNPELDNYQERKSNKNNPEPAPLIDRTLQRAFDSATALLVMRESAKTGN